MPLDGTTFAHPTLAEIKAFWASTPRERLTILARDLRSEEIMRSHMWDFTTCYGEPCLHAKDQCGSLGCAIGLANWRYGKPVGKSVSSRVFNTSDADSDVINCIFGMNGTLRFYGCQHDHVTPAMVADKIDAYLQETLHA